MASLLSVQGTLLGRRLHVARRQGHVRGTILLNDTNRVTSERRACVPTRERHFDGVLWQ